MIKAVLRVETIRFIFKMDVEVDMASTMSSTSGLEVLVDGDTVKL